MTGRARRQRIGVLAVALLLLGLHVQVVGAQQERGTVTGEIVDSRTQRPLSGVQVMVPGTGIGALSNAAGRFLLVNVPAGETTVRARLIGYRAEERTVTVRAGETANATFELHQEALALDEVVVTGTAGQARRREVGNSIAQLNLADVAEPVADMDNLLQGRAAGVTVMENTGMAGAGAQIRLRGGNSVTMSNQPLIYVDGVRLRSDGYPLNNPPVGFVGRSGNVQASPLNDINPADIERVEIIKGAAATTLYGTEAAAGVIQIFTRRGATGRPSWTAQVDQGFARLRPFGVDGDPTPTGARPEYLFIDPWLRDGHRQRYSLSVGGGAPELQYFISGSWEDLEGVLPNDWEQKLNVRGNFTVSLMPSLQFQWNTSYTNHDIQNTPAGNNAHGLTLNAYRRDRNYFQSENIDTISQILDYDIFTYNDRFVTGATATYAPRTNFTHRFTVGYDLATSELRNLRPYHFLDLGGFLSNQRWSNASITADYVGSLDLRLTPDLRANLAWGGQSITNEESSVTGYAENFPGPGIPTLSSGATRLSFEDRIRVINAGLFAQALFDFRDRYFLTVGLRVDGNSAFGQDFGLQPYPKVSASYVISDEPFWPEMLGQMKLRAAYGHAGRAPGAFDAVRTWDPIGWGGQPAFQPLNVGNPVLGPERTAETEVGFDASFLDDRLGLDFTWYHQHTTNALFNVRQIPSRGFLETQLENVGELENRGIELAANAVLIRTPSFGWDVGVNLSTNHSKVLSLGGAPEFSLGDFGWIIEGQPAPVIRAHFITNPNEIADPVVEQDHIYGPNLPTHTIAVRTGVQLPRGIALNVRGEYQGGHYMYDGASLNALNRGVEWPTCFDAYPLIAAGQHDQLTARQRMWCIQQNARADWFVYPADFFKLREVTLTAPVPFQIPGASSAQLTLSGRNVWRWLNSEFPIFDPEIVRFGLSESQVRSVWEHIPPPAIYTASLRLTF